jgi:hypothetical protein
MYITITGRTGMRCMTSRRPRSSISSPGSTALTKKRASLAKEIARAERAIELYLDAFENGDLDPARSKERLSGLDARLGALQGQDQALGRETAGDTPATPDAATLEAVADELGHVVATGDTDQAKALLRILIAELRVNGRREILPTYRVATTPFAHITVQCSRDLTELSIAKSPAPAHSNKPRAAAA